MKKVKTLISLVVLLFLITPAWAQENKSKNKASTGKAVLWKPVKINQRDTFWGPGGKAMYPNLKK